MTEPPDRPLPPDEPPARRRLTARRVLAFGILVFTAVYLILLVVQNRREVHVDYVFGSGDHRPSMYALNFYTPMVADQLRTGRKSATIRLGDKSSKYRKGMVVQVLCGNRFSPREKIFDAVIDKVEVKTLGELSPREIEHDNPEIRRTEDMATFLSQLYNREVTPDDTVTVIRFSQIVNPRGV